jgi:formylglycine-generating enzyme required for sulfatase activity
MDVAQTEVTLRWEATPTHLQGNRDSVVITGYKVYFAKTGENYGIPEETDDKELNKTNLDYGATYKWKVTVEQSDDQTVTSMESLFTTIERAYSVPQVALVSPTDEATGQATTVTLTWEATPGIQTNTGERAATIGGYGVYFGKSGEDYPAPQWVTGKMLQKSNLEYNATYKWQVTAVQSDGSTATSTERTFTTAESYGAPEVALKTPNHLSTGQATTVTLTWEATPGVETIGSRVNSLTGYDLYFAKASEDYGAPQRVNVKEAQKSALEYGTAYKWKVVALQSDEKSAASAEWIFTTVGQAYTVPQVALVSPTDEATGQVTTLTLTWEATPGIQTNTGERAATIAGYHVYFGKNGEGYPAPQWVMGKTLQKTNLEYNVTYKWQVTAVQSDGSTATSTERTFTTAESYGAPEVALKTPTNLSTGQATTVTLTWEATPGVETIGSRVNSLTGYDLYFAKASEDYGAPQRVNVKEAQKSALEYGTAYKWKVVALQSDEKSAASAEWIFTTLGETYGNPQISLTAPANGATGQATTVTLTWEATPGAQTNAGERAAFISGYRVYFGKSGEEYPAPQWVMGKTLQKSNLEYNATYKWQVTAVQSDGSTATSTERTFTTAETQITAPKISLLSPTYEATMVSLNPTLSWEATPGAQTNTSLRSIAITSYDIYFSKTSEEYPDPENVTGKQLVKQNLEPWTEYKWKVVVTQSDGQQATTPEATFLTAYTFLMGNTRNYPGGADEEKPIHGVVFSYEYEIGTYEVTFERYDAYLLATGHPTSTVSDSGWGRGNRPVINVSWQDAVRYCNWLSDQVGLPRAYNETTWELLDASGATTTDITQVKGWRLPTEAEWEYAARGGAADIVDGIEEHDYLYAGSDDLNEVGWYLDNSFVDWEFKTQPVGQKNENELGLYDMSGNVQEWCHDRYGGYSTTIQTNPTGPNSGTDRMIRGGSWDSFEAQHCRVAIRNYATTANSSNFVGFRVARTVD